MPYAIFFIVLNRQTHSCANKYSTQSCFRCSMLSMLRTNVRHPLGYATGYRLGGHNVISGLHSTHSSVLSSLNHANSTMQKYIISGIFRHEQFYALCHLKSFSSSYRYKYNINIVASLKCSMLWRLSVCRPSATKNGVLV